MLRGRHESARPPAAAAHPDRPFRLSARLPVDLRARGRGARRPHHRPRARRAGQRLHRRRDLRQGRALRRAHPPSRPADAAAAPRPGRRARASSRRSRGTTRSTSSAEKFLVAEARYGARGGLALLLRRHHGPGACATASTGCATPRNIPAFIPPSASTPAWTGFAAGTGRIAGPDPREMAKSDLVVIWGTNPVNTQVNVMTHAMRARKERGAKIVAVDVYMNGTMEQADLAVLVRPGTDGALACAVMHCLFRDGKADWDYLDKYTDAPRELEAHRAHARSAMGVGDHRLPGRDHRGVRPARRRDASAPTSGSATASARSRNGAVNMHAASCIAGGHRRLAARGRRRVPQQRRRSITGTRR